MTTDADCPSQVACRNSQRKFLQTSAYVLASLPAEHNGFNLS